MRTDIIRVYSDLNGSDKALNAAEKFAVYNELAGKNGMHLRLLTEETISMLHGIMDDFSGSFWIESEETKKGLLCRICLTIDRQANMEQEEHILSVASSGKNESTRGVVGKIRELIRRSIQSSSSEEEKELRNMSDAWLGMGTGTGSSVSPLQADNVWSLQLYRNNLAAQQKEKTQEWDELEKSIIAKLSDEVKVWLMPDETRIVVEKLIKT